MHLVEVGTLLDKLIESEFALGFGARFEIQKVDKKQTFIKTETGKLYSRGFRRMSLKSMLIILRYTVSKLVHFLDKV